MNLCLKLLVIGLLLWDQNKLTSGQMSNGTGQKNNGTGVSSSSGTQAPTLIPTKDPSTFNSTEGPSSSHSHQPTSPTSEPTTTVSSSTKAKENEINCSRIDIDKPSYKSLSEELKLKNIPNEVKNKTLTCYNLPSTTSEHTFTLLQYNFSVPLCTSTTFQCELEGCKNNFTFILDVPPKTGSYKHNISADNTCVTFEWTPVNGINCKVDVKSTCTIVEQVNYSNSTKVNRNIIDSNGPGGKNAIRSRVKDLKPYTQYDCTSNLLYGENIIDTISAPVNTTIGKPEKVQNLNCTSTNTTITCTWEKPKIQNGPLSGYKFRLTKMGDNDHEYIEINGSTSSYYFSDLDPFEHYQIEIKAFNSDGGLLFEGDTEHVVRMTKEGIPTAVRDHKSNIGPGGNNAITVECREPSDINGNAGEFILKINNVMLRKNTCNFHIKDLSYLTTYNYKIFYRNNKYDGIKLKYTKKTYYNDKALVGFLAFLITITSLALIFVLFKIYDLQKKSSSNHEDSIPLTFQDENQLLNIEPIPVEQLLETYKRKNADEGRLFLDEFQSIPRVFSKFPIKEARLSCNQPKNRYIDILPYDDNRVVLSEIHGEPGSDYINASYINGFKEPRKYIAAQGPKEETMNDFWRMIWEQKSTIIVMVTRCEEGNRNKCAQYWPTMEEETEKFGDLVVKITEEKFFPDYITRKLYITNKREKSERDVTHIQFTIWPDHGVPDDPNLLLKLRRRVNALSNFFSGPIIVHCSAGVGRTGTYISIDAMLEGLEAEGRVDVYGFVVQLRRQRCLMVQVESQYIFIHKSLVEYNQFGETEVNMAELPLTLNNLKKTDTPSEPSQLKCEFQRLPSYKNWRPQGRGNHQDNKDKNRNSSVIPYEFNRVHIRVEDDAENNHVEDSEHSSDEDSESEDTIYINASYITGYWGKPEIIAAQSPLKHTLPEFWKMIFQKKVKAVVMLSTPEQENSEVSCALYWKEKSQTYDDLEVELTNEKSCGSYTERCFAIRCSKRKDVRKVSQFHYGQWEDDLSNKTKELLEMIEKLRKDIPPKGMNEQNRHDKSVPLLVHCSDGSQLTGTFCALWNLVESAHTEGVMDVFQTVKHLRRQRSGMISSCEQYQFLYDTLASTVPAQNGQVKSSSHQEDKLEIQNELENNIPEEKKEAVNIPISAEDYSSKSEMDETVSNGPSAEVTLRIDE
ncbi:receptor-type tyrosine-protein phosphatase C isoform X2 [Pseudophryne corroboree]|uniref:receptor-type tyrosine-protein phosphatase C isoform X2 n=1 Tax=Pseudophryne corroboree TaxID=495146 RepID=UPI00308134CA